MFRPSLSASRNMRRSYARRRSGRVGRVVHSGQVQARLVLRRSALRSRQRLAIRQIKSISMSVCSALSQRRPAQCRLWAMARTANDAGQFAMIDKIPAGDSVVTVRARLLRPHRRPLCAPGDLPVDAHAQHFLPACTRLAVQFVSQQSTDCRSTRTEKRYRGQGTSCLTRQDEGHLIPGRRSLLSLCEVEPCAQHTCFVALLTRTVLRRVALADKVYDECEQNEFAEGC